MINQNSLKSEYFPLIHNLWKTSQCDFPSFLEPYPEEEKKHNEAYLESCIEMIHHHRKSYSKKRVKKWADDAHLFILDMLRKQTILPPAASLSDTFISTFQNELLSFLKKARESAPELSMEDVGQAIRNYMVFALFKKIHEVKSGFSYAAFGYSMLYPVTDNYIDDPSISSAQKQEYNEMIRLHLTGSPVRPLSAHQQKTCEFLDAIESEFPRNEDDTIYLLLQMMLEAQVDSLKQQQTCLLSEDQRLDISIAKGGLSVFIDRYLIKKELTEEDIIFYLAFGLFLQLADDLQDIEEDSRKGSQTIFTIDTNNLVIERKVNQLIHFTHHIITNYDIADQSFKEFVSYCSYQLILTSIMKSKEYFSAQYLENIQRYLPVSMKYIDQKHLGNHNISTNEQRMFEFLDHLLADMNG